RANRRRDQPASLALNVAASPIARHTDATAANAANPHSFPLMVEQSLVPRSGSPEQFPAIVLAHAHRNSTRIVPALAPAVVHPADADAPEPSSQSNPQNASYTPSDSYPASPPVPATFVAVAGRGR